MEATPRNTVMTWPTLCVAVFLALAAPARPGCAQTIRGTVREDASNQPVAEAAVRLLNQQGRNLGESLTDADGQFTIRLPAPGVYRVEVRRIGYTPARSDLFLVGPDDEPSVDIYLTAEPVRLDPLDVVGDSRIPHLERAGFYRRLEEDVGHFILREEIEERTPRQVTDLFYGFQGGRVVMVNALTGDYDVVLRAGTSTIFNKTCFPTIVIDGVVVRGGGVGTIEYRREGRRNGPPPPVSAGGVEVGHWNELVQPGEIEAIEVYSSPAGLPVEYAGSRSPCGAILIWTRRGTSRP